MTNEVQNGLEFQHKDNVWENIKLMFKSIKEHPHKVEQFDKPEESTLGYKSTVDDSIWFIKVADIKKFIESEAAQSFLSTVEGKVKLLEKLNEGK